MQFFASIHSSYSSHTHTHTLATLSTVRWIWRVSWIWPGSELNYQTLLVANSAETQRTFAETQRTFAGTQRTVNSWASARCKGCASSRNTAANWSSSSSNGALVRVLSRRDTLASDKYIYIYIYTQIDELLRVGEGNSNGKKRERERERVMNNSCLIRLRIGFGAQYCRRTQYPLYSNNTQYTHTELGSNKPRTPNTVCFRLRREIATAATEGSRFIHMNEHTHARQTLVCTKSQSKLNSHLAPLAVLHTLQNDAALWERITVFLFIINNEFFRFIHLIVRFYVTPT